MERLALSDWRGAHGTLGDRNWPMPLLVARSDESNRADQHNHVKANEYLDEPKVLAAKVAKIAELVRASRCTVAYTGAGLSRSSGIPDYASKAKDSVIKVPKLASALDAEPTRAHFVLSALERAQRLHYYVQQNHDGLPQKAGFPQEKMNEIHGAWFDPSNPVVPFSGTLRSDLFAAMAEMEEQTDLCLCLGTSLSGMNADRMARTPAERSLDGSKRALGTVLINLQQTQLDAQCAVRVWAKLDDAMSMLATELSLTVATEPLPLVSEDRFELPYDRDGARSERRKLRLDLRPGAKVRIAVPQAMNADAVGEMRERRWDGNFVVQLEEEKKSVLRVLGRWWITAALRGAVEMLPLVNR